MYVNRIQFLITKLQGIVWSSPGYLQCKPLVSPHDTMKSILPNGLLKTKLIIVNYNNHDKKPILQIAIIIKDHKNSSILPP